MGTRVVIETTTLIILLAALAVPISWLVPASVALDAVALWTAGALVFVAPWSALWLLGAAVLTPLVLGAGTTWPGRDITAAGWAMAVVAAFVAARLQPGIGWIGGAFFTLRTLHVVGDWWMGRLAVPTLRAHLRYQLFLPVIVSGPIHRLETFDRQAQRRRWDAGEFLQGLERALVGAFGAVVIGGRVTPWLAHLIGTATGGWPLFLAAWLQSACEWVTLYFVFAGFTSIALGLSLMIGLRLEENFDRPWAARNLIAFWMRWHMSLTRWCRDYVFRPVTAVSRSPLAGLFAAMLVVGLWHAFSLYYLLWAVWQAGGVILTRLAFRVPLVQRIPPVAGAVLGPLFVLAWLSIARPLLTSLLGPGQ